ncbi:MAG: hypothetical protein K2K72_01660 [Duncaniella sp.]|nr:hypothetical protein [Duncaniella sp.]
METKPTDLTAPVQAPTPGSEAPRLDTWELIRKNPADDPADSDDPAERVLANCRPSIWDLD